ncbi:MAG: solute:sodium symporter family transporter, partial [OM182 bacterium]
MTNFLIAAASCTFFMALVAWVSYRAARREADTQEGYFLAGRGLGALFIAGSMLLTNLSAEQLVGLNGSAYGYNLSSMAWEVTAAFATIAMAFVFLPKYLAGAFTTLPEFLRSRYDDSLRRWTVLLFMVGYGLVTIPSVLYAGSLAVLQLFDLPLLLDIGRGSALVLTIWTIGLVGSAYAIFGGMRAIAVSDTLNGMGLLVMGLAIPLLGLRLLGEGDIVTGAVIIATEESHKLNAIGGSNDPTPFATLFTGMLLANLFYWCTNQYVIQRTLSARSLAEGQKGVLLSGFFKVMVPLIMMLPGVIAYHLYWGEGAASGLSSMDLAYPQLVRDVLPGWAQGLFL